LNFPPDEESLYTNTGYNLLALIAERVTTDRFSDWTDQHLFTPLGMSNSFFHQSQGRIIKSLARSYAPSDRQKWTEIGNQLTAVGSSSLFTTVEDLLRWIQHFDTPTLLEAGDYYEDLLSKRPNETPESRYHWGLLEGTYEGKRQFHHGGAWAGFHTYLIYLPEQQLGVVALSNRTDIHIDAISYKILDVVSPPIEETKTPIIESAPRGPNTNPDEGLVWVGHYQSEGKEAHRIQFSRSNEAYRIKIDDQEPIPLAPIDQNHYHNEETALNVAFSTQHIGWPRRLKLTSSSLNTTVIETFDWPQDRNSEYDGTYYSKELKAEYRISTTKAGLTATHHRHGSINLTPTSKDRFISKTWFWKQSEFKRDRDDEIMGLEINQSRNRGILFTKRRSGSPTRD
ncbi:beta-lactamase family protein, partial [Verrucomicrobia bacterium]|nr:beta-lactamase family protein [Verrucomicrobiota bacterium]